MSKIIIESDTVLCNGDLCQIWDTQDRCLLCPLNEVFDQLCLHEFGVRAKEIVIDPDIL